jgi:hypothetical protein
MEEDFAKRQKLDALAALIGGAVAGEDGVLRVSAPAMAAAEAAPVFPTFPVFPPPPQPAPEPPEGWLTTDETEEYTLWRAGLPLPTGDGTTSTQAEINTLTDYVEGSEPSKPRKHLAGLFSDEGGMQGWLEQERARRRRSRDKRVPERD